MRTLPFSKAFVETNGKRPYPSCGRTAWSCSVTLLEASRRKPSQSSSALEGLRFYVCPHLLLRKSVNAIGCAFKKGVKTINIPPLQAVLGVGGVFLLRRPLRSALLRMP